MEKKARILKLLEAVSPIIPAPIYWEDINSVLLGGNDAVFKATGAGHAAAYVGKNLYELYPKEMAEHIKLHNEEVMRTGQVLSQEEAIKDITTGEFKYFTAIKAPLLDDDGKIIGIVGTSIDITYRKKMEEELQIAKNKAEAANHAKTEFISNMSHDIRTPLTGVVGMSKMLEDSVLDSNQKQYAHWLGESGDQLLRMLNGILDVISADNINEDSLNEESFDIYQMIQDIIELERPTMLVKNIELVTHIDETVPTYLISDHSKLHRIILNLVGNAIKFTEKGYVDIEVKLLKKHEKSVNLAFRVSDTGIGIPEALQDKVFDRFFRVTPSYKGIYTGHGVGLHIAQSYCHLLGGNIQLKSELNIGTSFYFDLTFKIGDKALVKHKTIKAPEIQSILPTTVPAMSVEKSITPHEIPADAPQLLLIEDNNIALIMLENLVTQAGMRFLTADDGGPALELAKSQEFALIITDLGLPAVSGIDFTKAFRLFEVEHHKNPIPIIGLTAHADGKIKDDCITAGMNAAYTKPITPVILAHLKSQYISGEPPAEIPPTFQQTEAHMGKLGIDLPDTHEALFELESSKLLNIEEASKNIGNNANLLKSILQSTLDELPKDKQMLNELHKKNNWEAIEKLAHRMKGGLVYCGAERLALACQYLERYRKAGHTKMIEPLYQQLHTISEQTSAEIKQWLQKNEEKP